MIRIAKGRALLACTMLTAFAPLPALAQSARETELTKRLEALEAAVSQLRAELTTARDEARTATAASEAAAARSSAIQASSGETAQKVAALEVQAAKPLPDGFKVAGTTFKINGFFKAYASVSRYDDGAIAGGGLGRDFYLPSAIPVGGVREGESFEAHGKQTRVWLTTSTPLGGHTLGGHLEFDFQTAPGTQGSQRTTNGYNLALRRAFVTYDQFLFGQEWTTFQYTGALPETTDFIGPSEGTVFVRQPQVRYTAKVGDGVALAVAVENPETSNITPASAALIENYDDRIPDVAARLVITRPWGEFSLAGVVRQLTVDTGALDGNATGWGLSFAGKVPFGPDKRYDIRFMASHGSGIGRYIGLNFAPDVVFRPTGDLETVDVTAGFAAVRLGWTPKLRSTVMGSIQEVDYPAGFVPPGANASAWSVAGNLFYSPVKNLDLGFEYRHGVRELVSGAKGELDRFELAARYNF